MHWLLHKNEDQNIDNQGKRKQATKMPMAIQEQEVQQQRQRQQ